jgi:hypothetical protein
VIYDHLGWKVRCTEEYTDIIKRYKIDLATVVDIKKVTSVQDRVDGVIFSK